MPQVTSSTHPGTVQLRSLLSPGSSSGGQMMRVRSSGLPNLRPLVPNLGGVVNSPQPLQLQGTLQVHGVRLPMQHRPPPPLTPAHVTPNIQSAPMWVIPPERSGMGNQIGHPPPAHHHQQQLQQHQHHQHQLQQQQPSIKPNDNFRITLTSQYLPPTPEQVTSTGNQRSTPSPAASSGKASSETITFDSYAQKAMDDLFSTIANIQQDSGTVGSPDAAVPGSLLADSSTGSPSQRSSTVAPTQNNVSPTKDDPNEDWCAVCMDGGDLVCCDRCPKVFHVFCHIPQLNALAEEAQDSWQCMLCTPIAEILSTAVPPYDEGTQRMNPRQLRVAQRLLLELYCQYDHSQPFREPVNTNVYPDYLRIIQRPMSLDIIKRRLEMGKEESYINLQQFVDDVRLIFNNAYTFNPKSDPVYSEAQALEDVFEGMLAKWLPAYAVGGYARRDMSAADEEGGKRKKLRLE